MLNFSENTKLKCEIFRQERFIKNNKLLSQTIEKSNISNFATPSPTEKKQITNNDQAQTKNIAQTQRAMDIAKSRHISTQEILQHDLLNYSPLFDGEFPAKPQKSVLVNEL